MKTQIFNDYADFLEREDKDVNGVSPGFAKAHPDWKTDNATNRGCWNCAGCTDCTFCWECTLCRNCNGCDSCHGCWYCDRCADCHDCEECTDCHDCYGCHDGTGLEEADDGESETARKIAERWIGELLEAGYEVRSVRNILSEAVRQWEAHKNRTRGQKTEKQ